MLATRCCVLGEQRRGSVRISVYGHNMLKRNIYADQEEARKPASGFYPKLPKELLDLLPDGVMTAGRGDHRHAEESADERALGA